MVRDVAETTEHIERRRDDLILLREELSDRFGVSTVTARNAGGWAEAQSYNAL